MGEKTQENSVMGYSAAYPTGAERCLLLNHGIHGNVLDKVGRLIGDGLGC